MASQSTAPRKTAYLSNGQVLDTPPLTVRLTRSFDNVYNALGLYFTSLLSLDPYGAAQNSRFNTRARPNSSQERPRWGGNRGTGGGGGGGGGPGGSGGGSGRPRTMGIDDVREPECGSCGPPDR